MTHVKFKVLILSILALVCTSHPNFYIDEEKAIFERSFHKRDLKAIYSDELFEDIGKQVLR